MTTTYITKQGDMFDSIAYDELGSSSYTSDILELNPDHRHIVIFSAGVELVLPEVDSTDEYETTKAPWED